jgi:RNA polymerase sigma-70 factor (ECF subfamily)
MEPTPTDEQFEAYRTRGSEALESAAAPEPPQEDGLSLESLYRDEFEGLLRTAFVITGSAARAEELVHDAFVAAHRKWARVSTLDRPGAWLRRAVINGSISSSRRVRHEARALFRLGNRPTGAPELIAALDRDDPLWSAVRSLPNRQRVAIVLHYVDDLAVTDIAETLDCAEATVRVHLSRGRTRLAEILDAQRTLTIAEAES